MSHKHEAMLHRCIYEHADGDYYCDFDHAEAKAWMEKELAETGPEVYGGNAFDLAVDCAYATDIVTKEDDFQIPPWIIKLARTFIPESS